MILGLAIGFVCLFPSDPWLISTMICTPRRGNGWILVGAVLHMFVDSS
jgi:hypothetical protein